MLSFRHSTDKLVDIQFDSTKLVSCDKKLVRVWDLRNKSFSDTRTNNESCSEYPFQDDKIWAIQFDHRKFAGGTRGGAFFVWDYAREPQLKQNNFKCIVN